MSISIKKAERIKQLPPYLFAEIDRLKREVAARGIDLINLGIGDPDTPTPPHIVARLREAAGNPANHRYPDYEGLPSFRQAAAGWMRERYGLTVDPATEVVSLIENGFLPDLAAVPTDVARRAKLLWLNYPNNPTSAVAPRAFFAEAIRFATRHNVIICHDAAYAEIYFGDRPPSLLELPGGREVGIEFHSLSKTFNMTGWRVGFAVGHPDLIAGLGKVKTNVDSGVFQAVQEAGIAALSGDYAIVERLRAMYRERREVLVRGLADLGLVCDPPAGTFYVWVPMPRGQTAAGFAMRCLTEAGVVVTPGNGFGEAGEGYIRLTLCSPTERLREAVERLRGLGL